MNRSGENGIPEGGFLKVSKNDVPKLSSEQRTILIRKGNELFNRGQFADAKRIFLTTGYTDGLMRLGDYYYQNGQPLEAFRMFWLAPDTGKRDALIVKMASVVRHWLHEHEARGSE